MLAHQGHVPARHATGIVVGIVPGAGATVSAFVAYGIEGQFVQPARTAYKLGNGAAEGIVAAKSAATASVGGALVPLLTMGIPGSGATAIILAAFLLHGIQPGPQVFVISTVADLHRVRRGVRRRDRHVHPRLLRDQAAVQGARCAGGARLGVRGGVLLRRRVRGAQQPVRTST